MKTARCVCFAAVLLVLPVLPQEAPPIDSLTAPIALYPDALIAQILTASTNVDGLQSFAAWMKNNAGLKGTELQDAAHKAGFDASFVALAPFAQVVEMMVQKPDWAKQLGQAFTANRTEVFDSIQRLRAQAQAAGNLKTTPQQQVQAQTTSEGQQVIVIEPANPQVVYVPQYNPQTVYYAPSPAYGAAAAGAIGFTAGVILGASSDHYYYGPWGWHGAAMYEEAWDAREDFLEDRWEAREDIYGQRQEGAQNRQAQRQTSAQERQAQRQTADRQANVDARQAERQTSAQERQAQRQTADRQAGMDARQAQRQTAASTSSFGGGQFASQRSGMSSGQFSGYESGAAARAQSMRGSSSLGGGRGGFRGGRRR